ncbi:MAG: MXAN_6640 family putative metalloprotease [Balneolales bacterium]
MKNKTTVKISFLFVFCLWQITAIAQHNREHLRTDGGYEAFRSIDRDVQSGRLTQEEGLVNKFYYAFEPEKLGAEYQRERGGIKCLTPLLIEYDQQKELLSNSTNKKISTYLTTSAKVDSILSPSGQFKLLFTTSGIDSVSVIDSNNSGIPDYVEKAALYADSSWYHQVNTLGFHDFLKDDKPYSIFLKRLSSGDYGYTYRSDGTTEFVVHSTFENFPLNDDPEGDKLGALKATIAHEMKHAIQYATTKSWNNDVDMSAWQELDATMMEEEVFPKVNDYHNYLPSAESVFKNPNISIPNQIFPYAHVTISIYFTERFGMQFWVDVWDKIGADNSKSMINAIRTTLEERNESFTQEFIRNYLWHYASGNSNTRSNYGFNEREFYPNVTTATNVNTIPSYLGNQFDVYNQAARFHEISSNEDDFGEVLAALFYDEPNTGLGLLAFHKDSTIAEIIPESNGTGMSLVKTDWKWEELEKLVLVTVNYDASSKANTRLLAGSGEAIEKMRYGDILENGAISHDDIEGVLGNVVALNNPYFAATRLVADVSGNGNISAYDAALIMKHLADNNPFPVDLSGTGFGPEYENFVPFSAQSDEPALAKFGKTSSDSLPVTLTMDILSEDVTVNNDLDIAVSLPDTGLSFSSAYLEIEYSDFMEFKEVILEDSQNPEAFVKINNQDKVLKIALAQAGSYGSGEIITVRFVPQQEDSTVHASIRLARLDETSLSFTYQGTDSVLVGPREPVSVPEEELPVTVRLNQNYPNPFNPSTNITFSLPEAQHANLTIYDITGREVAPLADGTYSAGSHSFTFNSGHLSSGIYIYRLQTPGGIKTKKMMLLK